jgi:sialic acid synthase SpsE
MRPGTGVSPARQHELVGRRTARTVTEGAMVAVDDVEGLA